MHLGGVYVPTSSSRRPRSSHIYQQLVQFVEVTARAPERPAERTYLPAVRRHAIPEVFGNSGGAISISSGHLARRNLYTHMHHGRKQWRWTNHYRRIGVHRYRRRDLYRKDRK